MRSSRPIILMLTLAVLVACSGSGGDTIDLDPVPDSESDAIDVRPEPPTEDTGDRRRRSDDTRYPTDTTSAAEEGEGSADSPIAVGDGHDRPHPQPTRPPADVEFRDYGENPFTATDDDNLSTFAVDVDTGSYTLMRQWVTEGLVPPPESVRPEEYVNFFDSGFEAPTRETFAVYADAGPTPFTERAEDLVMRIAVEGAEVDDRERPPASLTFVVDVSGSMERDGRLGLVQDAVATLVRRLDHADTVSVVAYDDRAWVVLGPTSGDDHRTILEAVDGLRPGGSTNAEAGVLLGYETAREAYDGEAVNRVVLLSDGVANVGEEGPEGIIRQIARDVDRGISLVSVGVGLGNYNDVLMEQLADGADGVYRYVDTLEEARRVFEGELTGSLVTVARDVKIQVEFDPDHVSWYRLIGFENRDVADRDFRDDRADGGEIGAGHSVTALYQMELAEGVRRSDRLADVSVRWADPDRGDVEEVTGVITGEVVSERWVDAPDRFRLAATVAAFAEELRNGRHLDGYDLWDVADAADALAREVDDPDVWELSDLVAEVARLER